MMLTRTVDNEFHPFILLVADESTLSPHSFPGLPGIHYLYKIVGQHSSNYPPSFLFRYLERLVRNLVFILAHIIHETYGINKRRNHF